MSEEDKEMRSNNYLFDCLYQMLFQFWVNQVHQLRLLQDSKPLKIYHVQLWAIVLFPLWKVLTTNCHLLELHFLFVFLKFYVRTSATSFRLINSINLLLREHKLVISCKTIVC